MKKLENTFLVNLRLLWAGLRYSFFLIILIDPSPPLSFLHSRNAPKVSTRFAGQSLFFTSSLV